MQLQDSRVVFRSSPPPCAGLMLSAVGDRDDYLPIWANLRDALSRLGITTVVCNPYPPGPFNSGRHSILETLQHRAAAVSESSLPRSLIAGRKRGAQGLFAGREHYFFSPRRTRFWHCRSAVAMLRWRWYLQRNNIRHVIAVNLLDHPELCVAAMCLKIPITTLQHGDYYYEHTSSRMPQSHYSEGPCSHVVVWRNEDAHYIRSMSSQVPISILEAPLWASKYESPYPTRDTQTIVIYESIKIDTQHLTKCFCEVARKHGLSLSIRKHPYSIQVATKAGLPDTATCGVRDWKYPMHERLPLVAISIGSTISAECAFLRVPVITVLQNTNPWQPSCPTEGVFVIDKAGECARYLDKILSDNGEMQRLQLAQYAHLTRWLPVRNYEQVSERLATACVLHGEPNNDVPINDVLKTTRSVG